MTSIPFFELRSSRRLLLLALALSLVVTSSWIFNASRTATSRSAFTESYFSNSMSRTGADTQKLIATLQGRLRQHPEDWQSYSQLGLAYLQRVRESGDPSYYQKAEDALNRALSLEPKDYVATSAMGTLLLARHQFSSALEWGENARAINPDRSYAYGVITDALVELGRYPEAVEAAQHMIDLRPDLSSYARVSYLRELHGDMTGAEEMMQWAVNSGGAVTENSAWARAQLANLYFNMGNLKDAEIEYLRTLQSSPGYIYALAGLGRVRAAQGRTEEAIDLLTRASRITPLPELAATLGEVYEQLGRHDEARKQYDLVEAIQQLNRANGVDVDLEMALFDADHGKDPAAVVEQARQAFDRRPSVYAADVMAWALYQAGRYEEAQTYAKLALRLGSQDALKLFHAGMIAYRLGQADDARNYLTEALEINPNFSILHAPSAKTTLEKLEGSK